MNAQARKRRDHWLASNVPDLHGRTALVTGASSGVGFETARVLASKGATTVLACRDPERAKRAATRIGTERPSAQVIVLELDLASLASVRQAADRLDATVERLDLLINNAGVMWAPQSRTADGFELHFGTNHLGHFAFTALILDRLLETEGSRVVTITSPAHRRAMIDFDDLACTRRYRPQDAYARSKLANVLFANALQLRLAASGARTISLAAHPGSARTELNRTMPALFRGPNWGLARPITHPAEIGALSILAAATDADARGGDYYAPAGRFEYKGYPGKHESSSTSRDPALQERLWHASEELTAVAYP